MENGARKIIIFESEIVENNLDAVEKIQWCNNLFPSKESGYAIDSISSLSSNRILYNYHCTCSIHVINTDKFCMPMYHKI